MTKKDEFVTAFQAAVNGRHPKEHHDSKDYAGFCKIVNTNEALRALFREAVKEAETEKNDPATGLSNLFGGV